MQPLPFREQLNAFTVVDLPLSEASSLLKQELKRFGTVVDRSLQGIQAVIEFLCPLKSFTTRYAAFEIGGWTCLLSDMKGANCYVEGFALSRLSACRALGVVMMPARRELHVFEDGKKVREVQSLLDGKLWYFRESGEQQVFEDPLEYTKRRKKDRLSVNALAKYFERYTGLKIPNWDKLTNSQAVGLERSTKDVRNGIIQYPTLPLL